jgi:large subunit ribosomal protein L7/L12
MAGNLDQIVEQLSTLSVLEAAELVKKLEEKGFPPPPLAMAAMPGAGAAAANPEEKTEFDG